MDQRKGRADLIAGILAIPVMNTVNLTPLDALRQDRRYASSIARLFCEALGDVYADATQGQRHALTSMQMAAVLFELIEQEALHPLDAAIERAEAEEAVVEECAA